MEHAFTEKRITVGCKWRGICLALILFVIFCAEIEVVEAQTRPTRPSRSSPAKVTLRSRLEGQFIARGIPFTPTAVSGQNGTIRSLISDTSSLWPISVRLDPSTLIVVCERIKQVLLNELGASDSWMGLIEMDVDFYPNGVDRPIMLSQRPSNNGLATVMKIPDEVTPHRLIQAVVQSLLLEMANQNIRHQKHITDVPLWIIEGFTQLIMERSGPALIPTPGSPKTFSIAIGNPEKEAKARLRTVEPPDFSTLSSPGPESMTGIKWLIFQDASLVMTWELLNLPDGKTNFRNTIQTFKRYHNWQLAFLDAWKGQFKTLTDVEKWWALVMVTSQKDTAPNSWTLRQSMEKLDEILSEASIVSATKLGTPKQPNAIHLLQIAEHWTTTVQLYFFERIAAQLKAFEAAAEPSVADLASRYRTSILDYIHQPKIYAFLGKDSPSRSDLRLLKRRFIQLDAERSALQRKADSLPKEDGKY